MYLWIELDLAHMFWRSERIRKQYLLHEAGDFGGDRHRFE